MSCRDESNPTACREVRRPAASGETGPWTVPNALTIMRIVGSFFLVWLAQIDQSRWFIGLFAVLLLSDWLDGKLAILLHQRSELGARLDSVADFVLYGCLLVGTLSLKPQFIRDEALLIGAMLGSFLLPVLVTLARFGRLPAYHTRAAKTCWLLTAIGAIILLAEGPAWPARWVLVAVCLTNVEALVIALVLRRWVADVPSLWHAVQLRREDAP